MNSMQISRFMNQDKFIRKRFKGVYPIDLIPGDLTPPSIIVVNLDRSYEKGSHWIVLHYNDIEWAEHFNSLGKKPDEVLQNLLTDQKIHINITIKDFKTTSQIHVDSFVYTTVIIHAEDGHWGRYWILYHMILKIMKK